MWLAPNYSYILLYHRSIWRKQCFTLQEICNSVEKIVQELVCVLLLHVIKKGWNGNTSLLLSTLYHHWISSHTNDKQPTILLLDLGNEFLWIEHSNLLLGLSYLLEEVS